MCKGWENEWYCKMRECVGWENDWRSGLLNVLNKRMSRISEWVG